MHIQETQKVGLKTGHIIAKILDVISHKEPYSNQLHLVKDDENQSNQINVWPIFELRFENQYQRRLTGKGMGGVTGEGRLRAGDWLGRCGGDCCCCPEVEEHAEPGDGTEVCCWLGGVM